MDKVEELKAERDRLWAIFEAQGGRGVELADQIDALQEQIDALEDGEE